MAAVGGISIGVLSADLELNDNLTPAIARAQQALSNLGNNLNRAGDGLELFGQRLQNVGIFGARLGDRLTLLTAPLTLIAGASIKMASTFEEQMVKLINISGVAVEDLEKFRQKILELAPALGKTPKELAEGLLTITSVGMRGQVALDILKESAKASAIGLGSVEDIARAVTAAMTNWGKETYSAKRAVEILHAAIREGGAEATGFAATLGRVISTAKLVGLTFEETVASVATFTRLGVRADEAVTALRGTLSVLLKPSKEARDQLLALGTSVEELRKKVRDEGLASALIQLIQLTKGNDDAIGLIVPNVRALAGALANAGSQAGAYREILMLTKNSQEGVNEAFERTAGTSAQKIRQFWGEINVLAISLGDKLLPQFMKVIQAALPLVDVLEKLLVVFGSLPSSIQTTVIAFGAFFLALGPIMSVGSRIVEVIGMMIGPKGLPALARWLGTTTVGVIALNAAKRIGVAMSAAYAAANLRLAGIILSMQLNISALAVRFGLLTEAQLAAGAASTALTGSVTALSTAIGLLSRLTIVIGLLTALWQIAPKAAEGVDNVAKAWEKGGFKGIWDLMTTQDDPDNWLRRLAGFSDGMTEVGTKSQEAAINLQMTVNILKDLEDRMSGQTLKNQVNELGLAFGRLKEAGKMSPDALIRFSQEATRLAKEGAALPGFLKDLVIPEGKPFGGTPTVEPPKWLERFRNSAQALEQELTSAFSQGVPMNLILKEFGSQIEDVVNKAPMLGESISHATGVAGRALKHSQMNEALTNLNHEMDLFVKERLNSIANINLRRFEELGEAWHRNQDAIRSSRLEMEKFALSLKPDTLENRLAGVTLEFKALRDAIGVTEKEASNYGDLMTQLAAEERQAREGVTRAWMLNGEKTREELVQIANDAKLRYNMLKESGEMAYGALARAAQDARDKEIQAGESKLAKLVEQQDRLARGAGQLGSALSNIGGNIGGNIGNIVSGFGSIVSSVGEAAGAISAFGKIANPTMLETAAMATTVANAYLAAFTVVVNMIMASEAAARKARAERNALITELSDGRGSVFGAHNLNLQAMMAGRDLATPTSILKEAIETQQNLLERYGLTWKDLGQTIRQANIDQITRGLALDFKALEHQLGGIGPAAKAMSKELSQLIVDAVTTGTKIPAVLQPVLEQMIRMGLVTEQAARKLLGLGDAASDAWPSLSEVTSAASAFNLTLDDLGPITQRLRLEELAKHFDVLRRAGVDATTIFKNMGPELQKIAQEALLTGEALPESMKPFIQALIDAGLLLDANGQKITDIGQIEFAKPLTQSIDELVVALRDLIDHMSKVATAAEAGFGRARGEAEKLGDAIRRIPNSGSTPAPPPAPSEPRPPRDGRTNPNPESPPGEMGPFDATAVDGMTYFPSMDPGIYGGTAIVEIGGETIAEVAVPFMRDVTRRYGLSRR